LAFFVDALPELSAQQSVPLRSYPVLHGSKLTFERFRIL
jgi:hypothetical protein